MNMSRRYNPVAEFHAQQQKNLSRWHNLAFPDIWLVLCTMLLICIGMVMVTSASAPLAVSHGEGSLYYASRQAFYYGVGILLTFGVLRVGTETYSRRAGQILCLCALLLLLVYVPGLGHTVNGARRWLNFRLFNLQSGEVFKLGMIIFTAHFLYQNRVRFRQSYLPMVTLIGILALFSAILLSQPDFGTTAVVGATVLMMMFLAGMPLRQFLPLVILCTVAMIGVIFAAPYRVKRLMTFLDPFQYANDSGYQLVQSLIAIGRGGTHGVGLGESIFKHQFVPEAHTDFIFAIISEEFGLLGALIVMGIFALLVWRAFAIGQLADSVRKRFACYLAYGIGSWIGLQSLINFGVVTGALPTKGLTLPLISYGGSSVIVTLAALGILMRIDSESRFIAQREGKL